MFKNPFRRKNQLKVEYIPIVGCKINLSTINWGENRSSIRSNIQYNFKEDNRIIELPKDDDGNNNDLEIRRDIYEKNSENKYLFFLSYDKSDKLIEIEIHSGAIITIKNIELEFGDDIDDIAEKLYAIGENNIVLDEGSFLYKNLKMNIASSEAMGGAGNGLDYFYIANDISHLIEEHSLMNI